MSQVKNNSFALIFVVVVIGMIVLMVMFLFSGRKKETKEENDVNIEKVEVFNKDTGNIKENLKKQVDQEVGKVEVKEDINVDMTKLFDKSDQEGAEIPNPETEKKDEPEQTQPVQQTQPVKMPKPAASQPSVKVVYVKQPVEKPAVEKEEKKEAPRRRSNFNDSQENTQKEVQNDNKTSSTIKVVVHNQQNVQNGSTLRMRATEEFKINGVTIPKNTFISGQVSITNQRVNVKVPSIEYKGQLYTVNYTVYDGGDGLEGASVPDLIMHDATKEEANSALSQVKINTPIVSVPIGTTRNAVQKSSALMTENYKLILRLK